MTSKQLLVENRYYLNKSKKAYSAFLSQFSAEEKQRAETCTAGEATDALCRLGFTYLSDHHAGYFSETPAESLKKWRPSTKKLFEMYPSIAEKFSSESPYFNPYFASWFFKKYWSSIVDNFVKSKLYCDKISKI